jgi:SAM-dependent methyltransferase
VSTPLNQHQIEIQRNLVSWQNKPLLRELYAGFYQRIMARINPAVPGRVLEIGSGIGNLATHLPGAIGSDLFPNPWLDVICDGYELPFADKTISHIILFDVFHHLEAPNTFLREARRALHPAGRVIIFDPFISLASWPAFGLLHHEPVAINAPINFAGDFPRPRAYYAAQGNATRLFFREERAGWLRGWRMASAEALASFSYLLSGGFSKPACYPAAWLPAIRRMDAWLSKWPRLFGARCLVTLEPVRDFPAN